MLEHVQENGGNMKNVRETILNSAKELLLKNGYSGTTIRGIIKESGVLSGSIYHFFNNKEDIFKSLILELFDNCERIVIEMFSGIKSPVFLYIILVEIELRVIERNDRIRELYYEAYTSDVIFEKIVDQGAKKSRQVFSRYNPDYSLSNYYDVNLMIKGAMRGYIIDSKLDKKRSSENRNNNMLNMILKLMNVKSRESQEITKEVSTMNIEIDYIVNKIIEEVLN